MPEVHNFVNVDNHSDQISIDRLQYSNAYKIDNMNNNYNQAKQSNKSSFSNLQYDPNIRILPPNVIERQKYDLLS